MDFCFVVVSALLLFGLDSVKAFPTNNTTQNDTNTAVPTPRPWPRPCPTSVPATTSGGALNLGFLAVEWGPDCGGPVVLTQLDKNHTEYVCFSSRGRVEALLGGVCEGRRGCGGGGAMRRSGKSKRALTIEETGLKPKLCGTLTVQCEREEERPLVEPQEPVGFRVATALLCVALILLLLLCFSKPTIKALQKRLSNKRNNRWIGPTQSHSVSYHRGQTVNKTMDGQKHSSYPALDRLTVGNREPSSNRNSYNF